MILTGLRMRGKTYTFTVREREVLEFISAGCADKEIAAVLGITARTVRFHISNLFQKTGARNRAQLAAVWLRYSPSDQCGAARRSPRRVSGRVRRKGTPV